MPRKSAPWNHNGHYHNYLLSKVPSPCTSALDIGCGIGHFAARLSAVCTWVEGIDSDQRAIDFAKRTFGSIGNLTLNCKRLQDCALQENGYNFVSLIAVLHHMGLRETLKQVKRTLSPGGVVAILGCFKEATLGDFLRALVAAPVNVVNKIAKGSLLSNGAIRMVTKEAKETLAEIRQTMNEVLPNHEFKRHLFWRYSVVWQKPRSEKSPA